MSALQEIVGFPVEKARSVLDYYQIEFRSVGISIMNDIILSGVSKIEDLDGRVVIQILECGSDITFIFKDAILLKVSLLPEAYHCPEAITFHRDGKPILIWN